MRESTPVGETLGTGIGADGTAAEYLPAVPLDDIHVLSNVRRVFEAAALEELAASIQAQGVLQPLVIRPSGNGNGQRYVLVAGERRLRAARVAGLAAVPCINRPDMSPAAADEAQIVENLQRRDLDPVEEAGGLQQLLTHHGWTQEGLGARLGRSQPWVANRLRLLRLPVDVAAEISRGRLSAAAAQALLPWADFPDLVQTAADELVAGGVTQARAPSVVANVVARCCPQVSGRYGVDTCDPAAHRDCPCRRMVPQNGEDGGPVAVCTDRARFAQVEAEAKAASEAGRRQRIEQAAAGGVLREKDLGQGATWQGGAYRHRWEEIPSAHAKAHAACACLRRAEVYGRACSVCLDPAAFAALERRLARERTKRQKAEIEDASVSAREWAAERLEQAWPEGAGAPALGRTDLALFAALVICKISADYSGPANGLRYRLDDYLRRVGIEHSGAAIHRHDIVDVAGQLAKLPPRLLLRICLEWPQLAEDPASPRSLGGWYRRALADEVEAGAEEDDAAAAGEETETEGAPAEIHRATQA